MFNCISHPKETRTVVKFQIPFRFQSLPFVFSFIFNEKFKFRIKKLFTGR